METQVRTPQDIFVQPHEAPGTKHAPHFLGAQVREGASPTYTMDEIEQQTGGHAMAISDVISLTAFKTDASGWVERLQGQRALVLTQNGRGRAVVPSFVAYRQVQDSLSMVRITGHGEADIQAGRLTHHDDVFVELRRELRARRKSA